MVATSVFYVQCVRKAMCSKQTVEHAQLYLRNSGPHWFSDLLEKPSLCWLLCSRCACVCLCLCVCVERIVIGSTKASGVVWTEHWTICYRTLSEEYSLSNVLVCSCTCCSLCETPLPATHSHPWHIQFSEGCCICWHCCFNSYHSLLHCYTALNVANGCLIFKE